MSQDVRVVTVKVTPNAKKNEIVGEKEGVVYVKIAAIPDKGRANEELIRFLAKEWGVKKNAIKIIAGDKGRLKRLEIRN